MGIGKADTERSDTRKTTGYVSLRDDADAKRAVVPLSIELGFETIDAGPLQIARLLEPPATLWIHLACRGGIGRDFAFRLMRR